MTKAEEELNQAKRHLQLSKLVSIFCVAAVLFMVNTDALPTKIRFGAVAVVLAVGFMVFVVGIRCAFIIPKLELALLRNTAVASSDPLVQSERGRGEA